MGFFVLNRGRRRRSDRSFWYRELMGNMKICLAASGGGHVRQILDLESFWSGRDFFFVTEDTALGQTIAAKHPTYFVPHVALGQARLGKVGAMLSGAIRNLVQSAKIIWRTRPDIVITTGAGSMFFILLLARIFGAKIVLIDSFARFERPSAFAKIGGIFAHYRIAQAAASAANWPGAELYDPFRIIEGQRPPKRAFLFATVGATLPFDRLVEYVAVATEKGLIEEKVLIQRGIGGLSPHTLESVETLPFDDVLAKLQDADIVVCHGGTGSLITALEAGCRVVAVPRQYELGEHYDDHQSEITQTFEKRGLLACAYDQDGFERALKRVKVGVPVMARTDYSGLAVRLDEIVRSVEQG